LGNLNRKKYYLGNQVVYGRIILKYILNKQGAKVWNGFIWLMIRSRWQVTLNMVMKSPSGSTKPENLLTNWATISFSRTLLHGISYKVEHFVAYASRKASETAHTLCFTNPERWVFTHDAVQIFPTLYTLQIYVKLAHFWYHSRRRVPFNTFSKRLIVVIELQIDSMNWN